MEVGREAVAEVLRPRAQPPLSALLVQSEERRNAENSETVPASWALQLAESATTRS